VKKGIKKLEEKNHAQRYKRYRRIHEVSPK
jgi:hypothetical protein